MTTPGMREPRVFALERVLTWLALAAIGLGVGATAVLLIMR
jgi:hypothetical protein